MADPLPIGLTRLVQPKALKTYALALGWQPVPGVDGDLSVFHRPDSEVHQLIIPLDDSYDDYGEQIVEAIRKLAVYEKRPAMEVLNHLLLPPADVWRLSDSSQDTEAGTLQLNQAVNLYDGSRRVLLSVAHSVLKSRPYHPRLSRIEAEEFIERCRVGQTERGSFTITVACPLDFVSGLLFAPDDPFARRVTEGVMRSLSDIVEAADNNKVDELADPVKHPLLSANLCEAILMLRPKGERSSLYVQMAWSKALPHPAQGVSQKPLQLRQDSFDAVEALGPKLRSLPAPKEEAFVGFVDVLRGQADTDGTMAGEVVFSIALDGGELIRAKADLKAIDYQTAGDAHLHHAPVFLRGYLVRGFRSNRLDDLSEFRKIQ
jgi:hypothetical protein